MGLRDLKLRLCALIARRRAERELDDEIAFHLERETQKHVANGMGLDQARTLARARFGSAALAADECRDARGTGLVDDGVRDVRFALRTFRRAPLAAVTIVLTVALGLGLVAVVFSFFNVFMFRVDNVRNPEELFAVVRPTGFDEREGFTYPQFEAMRRETRVFSDMFAMIFDIDSRIDGRMMAGALVTGNFFEVVGVNAALGRTLTPADDVRSAPRPVMVLSHRGMALGATVRDVAWMVLSQAVRPVIAGIAVGAALAAALATVLTSTLGAASIGRIVHVFDPVAYAGSLLCIVAACALASLAPSIRAARVDPMNALRQD